MHTYRQVELPEELQRKMSSKFWKTSALARIPSSTFGTSPKARVAPTLDDGYEVTRTSKKWLAIDKHNCNHGRVRIETMLGRLEGTPAPGHYSPKIDKQSKRETIAPMITISSKPEDRYLEDMEDMRKTRETLSALNPRSMDRTKKKRIAVYKIKPGQLAGINIDDMRKALLPGPGTYDANFKVAERFERPPSARLKPRKPAAVPRK
eukprot:gene21347-24218_t